MKAKIILQDTIQTMGVQLRLNRQDITSLEFRLDPDIFLNDCLVDGKSYEINLFSTLKDGWRYYRLPIFLSSLELQYDSQLRPDGFGTIVLKDEDGWLPVWPEADTLREFEIRYPKNQTIISNYVAKPIQTKERFAQQHLVGQGPFELIWGDFQRAVHYSNRYYLHDAADVELFDKFLRETKVELERDWGKPDHWPNEFVQVDRELDSRRVIAVHLSELQQFPQMPKLLQRIIMKAYPIRFGEYFKSFDKPLYHYLAWRSLRGVMTPAEQAKLFPGGLILPGPLVESEPGEGGVAFFKALEDAIGRTLFQERVRTMMTEFRDTPLSLVHFINLFGQEEAAEQLLERWLFMGHR